MLKAAVNHYADKEPESTLMFQTFFPNYIPGNAGKPTYAYVKDLGNIVGKPEDDKVIE
jgi:hypothetical protein